MRLQWDVRRTSREGLGVGAFALACALVLGGCRSSDFNLTGEDASSSDSGFKLLPATISLVTGESKTFTTSGGQGPYTFEITVNHSGATIDAGGVYVAGPAPGVTDTLRVTDAKKKTASATVTVVTPLALSLPTTPVMVGDPQTFSASGGVPPYAFSLSSNDSAGSIGTSSGSYTAGTVGGVTDTVRVTDSASPAHSDTADVDVNEALELTPASLVAAKSNTSRIFTATGGVGAYTLTLGPGGSGGTLNGLPAPATVVAPAATYDAGPTSSATDTVRVTDAQGHVFNATITVNATLSAAPAGPTANPATAFTLPTGLFTVSGGVPPYTYLITGPGGGLNPASTLLGGTAYTTGDNTSVASIVETLTVRDSDTNAGGSPTDFLVAVTIENRPDITSVVPSTGTVYGGTPVRINGVNLSTGTVKLGGVTCTSPVATPTTIDCLSGAFSPTTGDSLVNVVVTVGTKTDTATGPTGFTYLAPKLYSSLIASGEIYSGASSDPFLGSLDAGNSCPNNLGYASNPLFATTQVYTLEPSGAVWAASTDGKIGGSPTQANCGVTGTTGTQGLKAIASTPAAASPVLYGLTSSNKIVKVDSTNCSVTPLDGQPGPTGPNPAFNSASYPICPFALTLSCNTGGTTAVTGCTTSTSSISIGGAVGGTGIAGGTTVAAIVNSTSVTLANPTLTCDVNSSPSVTNCGSTGGLLVGNVVSGYGIQAGSQVLTVDSATAFTLTLPATQTSPAVSLAFAPATAAGSSLTFTGVSNAVQSDCSLAHPRFRSLSLGTQDAYPLLKLYLHDYSGQVFESQNLSTPVTTVSPQQQSVVFF